MSGLEINPAPPKPINVFFGIPAYRGQVHYGHVMQMQSLVASIFLARSKGIPLTLRGVMCPESCSVDWARNTLLHHALKDESDWLFTCDADTFYASGNHIVQMIGAGYESGAAVVAAPVRMRGKNSTFNVLKMGEGRQLVDPESWKGKVIEVDRIGTAFMAINCNWIRQHWPEQPWFVTRQLPGPVPNKIGEDMTFCDGVRERGGLILADGRFEPHHVGAAPMGTEQ